mgnify:FL=1
MVAGLHDVLVVERREDARDRGLADLAALRLGDTDGVHDRVEVLELLDLTDLEKVDPAHLDVGAKAVGAQVSARRRVL